MENIQGIPLDRSGTQDYHSSYRKITINENRQLIENTQFSQSVTDFLKAFGNKKRQEIFLSIFADGQEHNVSEVAERARIAQSTASEHLSILKRARILGSRKVEKEVFYKLNRRGVITMLDEIKSHLSCCLDD